MNPSEPTLVERLERYAAQMEKYATPDDAPLLREAAHALSERAEGSEAIEWVCRNCRVVMCYNPGMICPCCGTMLAQDDSGGYAIMSRAERAEPAVTRGKYVLDEVVLRLERYRVSHDYGDSPDVVAYAKEIIALAAEPAGAEQWPEYEITIAVEKAMRDAQDLADDNYFARSVVSAEAVEKIRQALADPPQQGSEAEEERNDIEIALKILRDHDMYEEAGKLRARAKPWEPL